ncbi:MAG: EAL domain-containing protein [Cyanobacteria bacterium J06598_1]
MSFFTNQQSVPYLQRRAAITQVQDKSIEGQPYNRRGPVELFQAHQSLPVGFPGATLLTGSLSMLLVICWVKICRLNRLIHRRDRRTNLIGPEKSDLEQRRPASDNQHRRYSKKRPFQPLGSSNVLRDRPSLKAAIQTHQLRVQYQPIVDLNNHNKTVGFEALVRWQHPDFGLLSPKDFLPLAEETGLIVDIDRWVLEQVCQQLQAWQTADLYPSVSVNFSGLHLGYLDVVAVVRELLTRYAVDPSQLTIEVTEGVMIADPTQAISTLKQLRSLGLRLSLDDFGTGYCSLSYLSQLPADMLKIDRSFITKLSRLRPSKVEQTNAVIVRSVLRLAAELDIQVVAEGIEHVEQCHWLQQHGCAYGQGVLFGAALSPEAAKGVFQETCDSVVTTVEAINSVVSKTDPPANLSTDSDAIPSDTRPADAASSNSVRFLKASSAPIIAATAFQKADGSQQWRAQ